MAEGLVLVIAPAGYGKSTLLSQVIERDDRPGAWLSLDPSDNDPIALLTAVTLALDVVEPVDPALLAALGSASPEVTAPALSRLQPDAGHPSEPVCVRAR